MVCVTGARKDQPTQHVPVYVSVACLAKPVMVDAAVQDDDPTTHFPREKSPCFSTGELGERDPADEGPEVFRRSHLDALRSTLLLEDGLSEEAATRVIERESQRPSFKTAATHWRTWCEYCKGCRCDGGAGVVEFSNFVLHLRDKPLEPASVRVYACTVSGILPKCEGKKLHAHPAIVRLLDSLQALAPRRPPENLVEEPSPDLGELCDYLKSVAPKARASIARRDFAMTLLRMCEPIRSADLAKIVTHSVQFNKDKNGTMTSVTFSVYNSKTALRRKTLKGKCPLDPHTVGIYAAEEALCPVKAMAAYHEDIEQVLKETPMFQDKEERIPSVGYFMNHNGKCKAPIMASTIAQRILMIMKAAGITTTAHSLRGAATSSAIDAGVRLETILDKAVWGSYDTFASHYNRHTARIAEGTTVTKAILDHVQLDAQAETSAATPVTDEEKRSTAEESERTPTTMIVAE